MRKKESKVPGMGLIREEEVDEVSQECAVHGGGQGGEVDEVTQECTHGVDQGMEVDEVT